MTFNKTVMAATLASLTLVACGGAPKQVDSLEQARSAYERASNDPSVARHAPKELDAAKDALAKAERAWSEEEKLSTIDRQAGLASKRIKTAELIAKSREDGQKVEGMSVERQRVQLDLRERQIARAEDEARRAALEAKDARSMAERMQKQLEALQAEQTERGMVLTLGDVLFENGQSTLQSGAARNVKQIAAFMKQYPEQRALIEGHTDSMGGDDFNMDLSRERAFAVRQALVAQGVSARRIETQGFGEGVPVASNANASGRQQNRRVEVVFPDKPAQVTQLED